MIGRKSSPDYTKIKKLKEYLYIKIINSFIQTIAKRQNVSLEIEGYWP